MKALGAVRRAFHERERVICVVFCASNTYSSIVELETVVAPYILLQRHHGSAVLDEAEVKGIFSVIFHRKEHGPTIDVSKDVTRNSNGDVDPIIGTVEQWTLDGNMVEVALPAGKYLTVPVNSVTLLPSRSDCESSDKMNMIQGFQVIVSKSALNCPENGSRTTSTPWLHASTDMRGCNGVSNSTPEILCAEVERPGGGVNVVGWTIGRVALDVPACELDVPLSDDTIKMTKEAFLRVWHMKCKRYREFCTYHSVAARAEAISEDYVIHRNAEDIRTSMLDRGEGQEIFRETIIRKALKTTLKLPLKKEFAQHTPLLYASMAVAEYASRRKDEPCSFSSMFVAAIKQAAHDKALPCRRYFLERLFNTIELDYQIDGRNTSGCFMSAFGSASSLSLTPTQSYYSIIYNALKSMIVHHPLHLCMEEAYVIFVRLGLISFLEGVNDFLSDTQVREMMMAEQSKIAAQELESFIVLATSLKSPRVRLKLEFDHTHHTPSSSPLVQVSKLNQNPMSYVILQKKMKYWYSILDLLRNQSQKWMDRIDKRLITQLTYNRMSSSSSTKAYRNLKIIVSSAEKTMQDAEIWFNANQDKMGKGIVVTMNHLDFQQDRCIERGIKAFACKLESSTALMNEFTSWIAPDGELTVLEVSPECAGRAQVASSGMLFGDLLKQSLMLMCHPSLCEHPTATRFFPLASIVNSPPECFHEPCVKGTVLRVLTERLPGWISLRSIIKTRGGCFGPDKVGSQNWYGGLVLRMWGRQLLSLILEMHKHALVLQDLRPETIFISPDGKQIKVYI